MLKNAKIYEEEIKVAMREYWYDLRHQYVCGWCGCQDFNVGESNYEAHTFASIDPETGKLLGAIGYNVDWASSLHQDFLQKVLWMEVPLFLLVIYFKQLMIFLGSIILIELIGIVGVTILPSEAIVNFARDLVGEKLEL